MPKNPLSIIASWSFSYRLLLKSAAVVEVAERVLRRLTTNRVGVLVGIPSVRLLIPGRRSGVVRATTLQGIETDQGFLVVGSNWARPSHPAWSANLQAIKSVRVRHRHDEFQAKVREIVGPERSEAWDSILRAWPNYAIAQEIASARPFRIFALAPAGRAENGRLV